MATTGDIEQESGQLFRTCALKLEILCPDVVVRIDEFNRAAVQVGPFDHYKVFPAAAHSIAEAFGKQYGAPALRTFLRAAIARAVHATVTSPRYRALPPRTAANHARHLLRIAQDQDMHAEWLGLEHDLFHKEHGLATMRLYAAGSQLVDYRCGVPRSVVTREGPVRALPKLLTMLRLGGFRPYFQIHTHKFNLDAFHEAGWEECYLCCAELYDVHPDVLGMFGSSWFYDPQLDEISPRLAYLRHTPASNGAALMYVVKGGEAIGNSTSTSPSRRKLYEEGKYMPTNYMLIWGRDAQRAWAARQPAFQAG